MALIKCQECGKEVSDKATACPKCGCPIEKETKTLIVTRPAKFVGSAIKGFVLLDNQVIGQIKSGGRIEVQVPIGKHFISVNSSGMEGNSSSADGKQIDISEDIETVYIEVDMKYSFLTELTGQSQNLSITNISYE